MPGGRVDRTGEVMGEHQGAASQAADGDIYFAGGDHAINGPVSLSGSGKLLGIFPRLQEIC